MVELDKIEERSKWFHSEINSKSLIDDLLKEHSFTAEVNDILVDAGEIEDPIPCHYQSKGLKVDAYYYDAEMETLYLVVSHWVDETYATVTNSEIKKIFKRCTNFFNRSLSGGLQDRIEISNEAHELSTLINECGIFNKINEVKIILITDGKAKKRPAEIDEIGEIRITKVIWDIERILNFIETGEREPITIDFIENNGGAIPCILNSDANGRYKSYLSYISGDCLADMYSQYGTKLLEMNVRVFLSQRGKINRGIRDTIINEPAMFCAYNNGITVFAREIEGEVIDGSINEISKAIDFQIVNGGQTIASLYHTRKKWKSDLSKIQVQMKLIVINNQKEIGTLVPLISEYSNTQNRVSMADLKANDPPHPELFEISRRLQAPDPTGGSRITYWFYEKSRGSYEETKNLKAKTKAQKKKYGELYPRKQRFDKNLFAKVWNTYLRTPHIVSLGGQKNFMRFNQWLREQKEDNWELFFKKTVALLILWKEAERIVRLQKFEGYRHNIVTYTLAWLFDMTDSKIDLDRIWSEQVIDEKILDAIEGVCQIVNAHIRDTEKNVTEWCKNEDCWKNIKEKSYSLPSGIEESYYKKSGKKYDSSLKADAEMIDFCVSKGTDTWLGLSTWLKERGFLSPKARSQCYNMGKSIKRNKTPSLALSYACKKAWEDAQTRGWAGENEDK